MKTKKVKKRFNILKFLVVALFMYIVISVFLYFFNLPIKNIIIKGTNYYNDEKIIETAKIENYPSIIKTRSRKIKKRLNKLELVESIKVKKDYFNSRLTIIVNEKKILFQTRSSSLYTLSDYTELELKDITGVPVLINYVVDSVKKTLVFKMKDVDIDIINKISEIEYSPSGYDKERFLLYMNDKNEVYITLSKFKSLNKYNSIKETLNGKKGILYLDSGNYFEIKN